MDSQESTSQQPALTKREQLLQQYASRFGHPPPLSLNPPTDDRIVRALESGSPVPEWAAYWKRRKELNARNGTSGVTASRD